MISIGIAAAQVGVSTSALRKWESRHGLPAPRRGGGGVRWYTPREVARLQGIKRRLDLGQPLAEAMQAVLSAPVAAVQTVATALTAPAASTVSIAPTVELAAASAEAVCSCAALVLDLLRTQGSAACQRWLQDQCNAWGVLAFVEDVAAPLMVAVGQGWAAGTVAVHEEHALAALLQAVLSGPTLAAAPGGAAANTGGHHTGAKPARPWLLATPSGEWHTLGLSMLHAVLHGAGVHCVNLGASVPNADLAAAARLHGAQGVALSLSAGTAPRTAQRQLQALRHALPTEVALWVGGAGVGRLARLPPGVHAPGSCQAARAAITATAANPAAARQPQQPQIDQEATP